VKPPATVSVDVDPVDLHLLGYGVRDLPPDPLVYTLALPRLAELFASVGVRATFFVLGRDAPVHADALRALQSMGHEIASHSLDHPMPFVRVPRSRLTHQLVESRRLIEAACGGQVVGFRAPNWDVSPRAVLSLSEAGYLYDASAYPFSRAFNYHQAPLTAVRMVTRPVPKGDHIVWSQALEDS
jgi:peptidoglycan/xylan/chitin deacetylase (PgdA/CDA1 family)